MEDGAPWPTIPRQESSPAAVPDTQATFIRDREALAAVVLRTTPILGQALPRVATTFMPARTAPCTATTARTESGRRTLAAGGNLPTNRSPPWSDSNRHAPPDNSEPRASAVRVPEVSEAAEVA